MRRRTVFILGGVLIVLAAAGLFVWVMLGGLEKDLVPASVERQAQWRDVRGPFIRTQWDQGGAYAALTPKHDLLGCWSVAFAQVLAHHRLAPRGRVTYRTSGNRAIDETLDQPVAWDQMVPALKQGDTPEASSQTARYLYHAAVVVEKDFGRGDYKDIARVPDEVTEHYGATVDRVTSDIAETVRSELRSGRPVVAYFDDILGLRFVRNGHAAVFDGVAVDGDTLLVHVNFGWGGASDGWYPFGRLAAERKLLYVFRIRP